METEISAIPQTLMTKTTEIGTILAIGMALVIIAIIISAMEIISEIGTTTIIISKIEIQMEITAKEISTVLEIEIGAQTMTEIIHGMISIEIKIHGISHKIHAANRIALSYRLQQIKKSSHLNR